MLFHVYLMQTFGFIGHLYPIAASSQTDPNNMQSQV